VYWCKGHSIGESTYDNMKAPAGKLVHAANTLVTFEITLYLEKDSKAQVRVCGHLTHRICHSSWEPAGGMWRMRRSRVWHVRAALWLSKTRDKGQW